MIFFFQNMMGHWIRALTYRWFQIVYFITCFNIFLEIVVRFTGSQVSFFFLLWKEELHLFSSGTFSASQDSSRTMDKVLQSSLVPLAFQMHLFPKVLGFEAKHFLFFFTIALLIYILPSHSCDIVGLWQSFVPEGFVWSLEFFFSGSLFSSDIVISEI